MIGRPDNGVASRGRGRPLLPRIPPSRLSDQRLAEILAIAAQLDPYELTLGLSRWSREGVHPPALRLTRRLAKQGPAPAQAFYRALTRYLEAAGLLEPGADETPPSRPAA